MGNSDIIYDISALKDKVVNYALISFTFLGILTVIAVSFNSYKIGFTTKFDLSMQIFAMLVLIFLSVFRKYISVHFKITILTLVLGFLCIINFYGFGILSNMKIFIAIFPIFLSFVVSLRKAILTLVFLILIYVIYGYLFTKGILVYSFNINVWANQSGVWLTGSVIIITASVGLLLVGNFFSETLKNNFILLKKQNIELVKHRENLEYLVNERTEELETVNEVLKNSNEEVFAKNQIINEQNIELKATLEHLRETQIQLMQSEKMASLGVLTAGVAHEINNPLNFIMGGYIGLEKYFSAASMNNDKKIQFFLNSIKTGIDRASGIIKGLNGFSRNNETLLEDCDIHSTINNCLLMLNNQIENRIEVNKNFAGEVFIVSGNVGKLHQAFINILSNSIQAIDKNGSISITTYKKEKANVIEISDTGCGIRNEDLEKIIEPFFTTKEPGKGIGLGLSIAYSIIQNHRGTIKFQSELNKGSTVKITLPNDKKDKK